MFGLMADCEKKPSMFSYNKDREYVVSMRKVYDKSTIYKEDAGGGGGHI